MNNYLESTTPITKRHAEQRLEHAHAMQVRDAEPLIQIESHLQLLIKQANAKGGGAFLSVEDDVPLAIIPPLPIDFQPDEELENNLFSGEVISFDKYLCAPIFIQNIVVGFICLFDGSSSIIQELCAVYAKLMAKELELANQNATLRYQNESISRKQKQLETAINFKNNILSLTTHDIRSPLTAVTGYLDMMDEWLKSDKTKNELLDLQKRIQVGVKNVSDLVDQLNEIALLELQRIELNSIKVDLNWIAQEVCDVMHGPAMAKKHKLTFKRYPKPLHVLVDITKAKRVLFNLIHNAIKYTPTGGTIEVSLEQEKRVALLHITDSGIGIPEDKQQSIFEPFHKINQFGTNGESATGLGLFTSNYFIQLFNGSITVESKPKVGSTFSVHLPVQQIDF